MGNQTGAAGLGTLGEETKVVHARDYVEAKGGTLAGDSVARKGFGAGLFVLACDAMAGNVDVKVQESDSGTGGWTDAAAGEFGAVAKTVGVVDANLDKTLEVDFRGMKDFVRLFFTGDANGGKLSALAVLTGADNYPTA